MMTYKNEQNTKTQKKLLAFFDTLHIIISYKYNVLPCLSYMCIAIKNHIITRCAPLLFARFNTSRSIHVYRKKCERTKQNICIPNDP